MGISRPDKQLSNHQETRKRMNTQILATRVLGRCQKCHETVFKCDFCGKEIFDFLKIELFNTAIDFHCVLMIHPLFGKDNKHFCCDKCLAKTLQTPWQIYEDNNANQ